MAIEPTDIPFFGTGWQTAEDVTSGDWGAVFGDTLSILGTGLGAYADPISTLIGAGLGFLVSAIPGAKDAIQMVTGDTEDCDAAAERWTAVGVQLRELAASNADSMAALTGWTGDASVAAGAAMADFRSATDSVATLCDNMARCLRDSGVLMSTAYDFVMGLISQAVEWFIATMVAASAAAPVSLGSSWAAGVAACQAEGAYTAAQVASATARTMTTLGRLAAAFGKFSTVLDNVVVPAVQLGWNNATDGQEHVDQNDINRQLAHP